MDTTNSDTVNFEIPQVRECLDPDGCADDDLNRTTTIPCDSDPCKNF